MALASGVQKKRVALLLWLLVAFFYFYLSYDYVRVTMNDRQFGDYLRHIVQIAGNEHKPAKEVRTLLLVKAEELSLPIHEEQITILGSGDNLKVTVSYEVDIEFPLLETEVYAKKIEHAAKYQTP